ncbi:hypothetical protein AB0A74_06975 [Saccharothrix sp. NPDC042600]|uniref:hypothetical protein n=1 Tax=Saccharothrix TaxID=2071 RepID=UPI0034097FDF|nr:hypothetical protein GCM10017745_30830 [Saccharothrix mutabilis subsp. capreolus]
MNFETVLITGVLALTGGPLTMLVVALRGTQPGERPAIIRAMSDYIRAARRSRGSE